MTSIRRKVERSSFGTKQARAARRAVSAATASRIVERAASLPAPVRSKKPGGVTGKPALTPEV